MINFLYYNLFNSSCDKQWIFESDDITLTNPDLVTESLEIEEGVSENIDYTPGTYTASKLSVDVFKTDISYIGKRFSVTLIVNGHTESPLTFPEFTVYSDKLSSDRRSRTLEMYDDLYKLSSIDIATAYNTYMKSAGDKTVGMLRTWFFAYLPLNVEGFPALSQVITTLPCDDVVVPYTVDVGTMLASDFFKALLHINCCNAIIGRDGKVRYVYPPEYQATPQVTVLNQNYRNCEYEEYTVQFKGIKVIEPSITVEASETATGTIISLSGNCMFYQQSEESLGEIAYADKNKMVGRHFVPFTCEIRGNPCIECGDIIEIHTDTGVFQSFIIRRTLKGIQALVDTWETGSPENLDEPFDLGDISDVSYGYIGDAAVRTDEDGNSYVDQSNCTWKLRSYPINDEELPEGTRYYTYLTKNKNLIVSTDETGGHNAENDATDDCNVGSPNYPWNAGYFKNLYIDGEEVGKSTTTAYMVQNAMECDIEQSEEIVLQATFNTNKGISAIFNGQAKLHSSADAVITVRYYLDNEIEDYIGEQTVVANGYTMLHLYKNFPALEENTSYVLKITMTVSNGLTLLEAMELHGSIICYDLGEMRGFVTASDIAVAHTTFQGTDDVMWAAYIESGVLKVKYAEDTDPVVWNSYKLSRITKARTLSMAFNANIAGSSNYYEFITDEKPYIAYTRGTQLHLLNLNTNESTLIVSGNVDDVSLVRSPKLLNSSVDYGFTIFFLMENTIYYRQMIDGEWYDAEVVDTGLEDVTYVSIEAFRTWDFRTGLQIVTSDGELYQLISYPEGLFQQEEHIEMSMSANVQLRAVEYHDTQETEHISMNMSANVALIYGLSAIPLTVENVEDEDESWATLIEITFDYPNTADSLNTSAFTLVDSFGTNYVCEGYNLSQDGLTLTLQFQEFNAAYYADSMTVSYTKPASGGLMSPATQTDSFSLTFVPTNLVDPGNPPEFLNAWNDSKGEVIYLQFDSPILNTDFTDVEDSLTVTTQEYNYVPNGTLQNVTHTVSSVSEYDGTVLDNNSAVCTDTEETENGIRLEVDLNG